MKPGIYYGMSNADYHASPGISKSGLDLIAKSPAHYFAKYLDPSRPQEDSQTAAQLDGELAHCAILEPQEFGNRFHVGPAVSRATKQWKEFAESLPYGATGIKNDQSMTAWRQAASVNRIPDVHEGLLHGHSEVSAYWIDEATGMLCKCRPDRVQDCGEAGVILIDVKTCGNASPAEFSRMIAKHRYHVQDGYYCDGFAIASGRPVLGFLFAAVEMAYPHAASAIQLDDESREQGRAEYRRDLDTYARCKTADEWPGYGNTVHLARLPGWAFDNEEDMEIGYVG
jgi:hypothetical protein